MTSWAGLTVYVLNFFVVLLKNKPALGTDHLTIYGFLFRSKQNFRTTQELEY
jgi:hypothetical protein